MAIDWLDLDTPPALPGLFLRAALRRKVTGRQLPNLGLRCRVDFPVKRDEVQVTVAAVREGQEAAAEPIALPTRPASAGR